MSFDDGSAARLDRGTLFDEVEFRSWARDSFGRDPAPPAPGVAWSDHIRAIVDGALIPTRPVSDPARFESVTDAIEYLTNGCSQGARTAPGIRAPAPAPALPSTE
ncbi:MAG: hypothetical protein ACF8PN_06785 [Phycisphaerales bacterium]